MFKYAKSIQDIKPSNNKGYLYILDIDYYDNNLNIKLENTCKLGMTMTTIEQRLTQYKTGIRNIKYINCTLPDKRERLIKGYLKHKTPLKPVCGCEYFKDCRKEIEQDILRFCSYDDNFIINLYNLYNVKNTGYIKLFNDVENKLKEDRGIAIEENYEDITEDENTYEKETNFSCSKCKKNYSSKFSLFRHSINCNKTNNISYDCKGCNRSFLSKQNCINHEKSCIVYLNEVNTTSKEQFKKQIKEELKYEILKEIKEELKAEILEELKGKHISKSITNINGLIPIDLSQEKFDNIVNNIYTYEVYSSNTFIPNIILNFFRDDKGIIRAILTDKERFIIKCINTENIVVNYNTNSILQLCSSSKVLNDKLEEYEKIFIQVCSTSKIQEYAKTQRKYINNIIALRKALKNHSDLFIKKQKKVQPIKQHYIEADIKFVE